MVCVADALIDAWRRDQSLTFSQELHRLCPPFLAAWEQAGGLDLVGLPLTEAFSATDEASGKTRVVQYFERARLERHPEQAGTPYEVVFGLLGSEQVAHWGATP